MLGNYIKIAWRNLCRNKIDSFISIFGLSIGLACCILLIYYVRFEWSHDNFHENADQIYRITEERENSGEVNRTLLTPYPLSTALETDYAEVEEVINVQDGRVHFESNGKFVAQTVLFAGTGFFEAFSFPLLFGDSKLALSNPNNIVLTEELAQNMFGKKQVVGKTIDLRLNEEVYTYTISGVAASIPANSSFQFEMVLPFESFFRTVSQDQSNNLRDNWSHSSGETWIVLNSSTKPESLEAKFPQFLKKYLGDSAEMKKMKLGLQPLDEAYFDQDYNSSLTGNSNIFYSATLGAIALVLLAIAGINFMGLTLSRVARRGHEIGIRKAAGAQSHEIVSQLYGEVFITCGIAFALGILLAELIAPTFGQLTPKPFQASVFSDPLLWFVLTGMLLMVTLITGSYPALNMSGRKAITLFSSKRSAERMPLFLKGLISVQFALSIAFLIATLVMNNQLKYLLGKDLGYSPSGVVSVELNMDGEESYRIADLFSQEARRLPGVESVSITEGTYRADPRFIQHQHGFGMGSMRSATTLEGFGGRITYETVDEYFLETLDMKLLEGRNFSRSRPSEIDKGIIVNEKFAEVMGWENPVGQIIEDKANWSPLFDGKKVIGVVRNFHFEPLYAQLQPMALQHINSKELPAPGTILIEVSTGSLSNIMNQLASLWDKIAPEETFNFNFLDEMVAMQYQEEKRWNNIIKMSSVMAIVLACLGLFGLSALSAQRRVREIGIRKVLGATVPGILVLLSKKFLKLVLTGFVVAIPIAWYAMNQWLQNFAYRIDAGPGVFLLAGALAAVIALATVSWQTVRAALANPVESLRNE